MVPSASGPSSELTPTLPPTPLLGAPSSSSLPPCLNPSVLSLILLQEASERSFTCSPTCHTHSHLGDRLRRCWSLGSHQ